MSTYAVVEISGKQFRVAPGQELKVQRLAQTSGSITFDKVLLFVEDGVTKIGTPYVSGVSVVGQVIGEEKGDKIHVRKYRAKSRYRKHTGFRAQLTRIRIESVGGVKAAKVVLPSMAVKPKKSSKK